MDTCLSTWHLRSTLDTMFFSQNFADETPQPITCLWTCRAFLNITDGHQVQTFRTFLLNITDGHWSHNFQNIADEHQVFFLQNISEHHHWWTQDILHQNIIKQQQHHWWTSDFFIQNIADEHYLDWWRHCWQQSLTITPAQNFSYMEGLFCLNHRHPWLITGSSFLSLFKPL